jgi:hypothetical protein
MDFFYIIVSVITVGLLVLVLTVVGLMMRNSKKSQQFPPNIEQCPDMWIPDGSFCHFNGTNQGNYISEGKYLLVIKCRFSTVVKRPVQRL